MAEISVWMAWITEAKNSSNIKAEGEVSDTRASAEATVGKDVLVEVEHDEDKTSNELSNLTLIWQGSMVNGERQWAKQTQKDKAKEAQHLAIK